MPRARAGAFYWSTAAERRAAGLFYRDLLGVPASTPMVEQASAPAWSSAQEQAFLAWWKKIAGLEGSLEQWKAQPANKFDRGGETNWGITWSTYSRMYKTATKAQFAAMTQDQAQGVARALYRFYHADQITNPGVSLLVTEWLWGGIQVKAFTRALATAGKTVTPTFFAGLDPATILALNSADPNVLIDAMQQERVAALRAIMRAVPSQAKFIGWIPRVTSRWVQAKLMIQRGDEAARWLNGQSLEVLDPILALLTREEKADLNRAAVAAAGVGPQSRLAELTRPKTGSP